MASLLLGIYAVEGIVRIPTTHHMALQFRPGAPALLEKLFKRQQDKKDIEVAILTSHTDFFGPKLMEPILTKYPSFHLIADVSGPSGRYILEKHWRKIAMEKNVQHSLRFMLCGAPSGVNRVWNSRETLCLDPFVAYDAKDRKKQREDARMLAKTDPAAAAKLLQTEDQSMKNLWHVVEDCLNAPSVPIPEVLATSAWVKSAHFPLVGDTFLCVSDE